MGMSFVEIKSVADERISIYRNLPETNQSRDPALFIAEGRWLVDRLVASPYETHSILVDAHHLALLPADLPNVPVFVTPRGLVEQIVGFDFHRGVLACGYRQPRRRLADVMSRLKTDATVVACADISDPTNLGGMLRNCAAFGVDTVLLSERCTDPFARRALRVSMGAVFKLAIVQCNLAEELRLLHSEHHFEIAATVLDEHAEDLRSATRGERLALVIGNESRGISPEVLAACQRRLTIPMSLGTNSLNAAVASGIFLFHFTRGPTQT